MSVAGRVVCPRCGANNFDTQAACWKCGAPLSGGTASAAVPTPPLAGATANGGRAPGMGTAPPSMTPAAAAPVAPAAAAFRPNTMDPGVAIWSAIALGILFPIFAVPVGIVFLMLDDRRKAEVGRVTLVWGVIGSIFHTLVTAWMIQGAVRQIQQFIPFPGRGGGIGGISQPQQPSLTGPAPQDAVRDLKFPAP